jgi:HPt (histidine-containing phosphotransfer) domain-containing protein
MKFDGNKTLDGVQPGRLDSDMLDYLRSLQRPGKPDVLQRIVSRYLDNAPVLLRKLHEAIAREDTKAIRFAAHNLKSGSASLGASQLAALSGQLENLGKQGSVSGALTLLVGIEAEYRLVEAELKAGYANR